MMSATGWLSPVFLLLPYVIWLVKGVIQPLKPDGLLDPLDLISMTFPKDIRSKRLGNLFRKKSIFFCGNV